ncbi:hypothetical protein CHU98_g4403 [Xylaria longipes]|nr:hypothetical protein CHU98_g4403 [Xylaria longipes]
MNNSQHHDDEAQSALEALARRRLQNRLAQRKRRQRRAEMERTRQQEAEMQQGEQQTPVGEGGSPIHRTHYQEGISGLPRKDRLCRDGTSEGKPSEIICESRKEPSGAVKVSDGSSQAITSPPLGHHSEATDLNGVVDRPEGGFSMYIDLESPNSLLESYTLPPVDTFEHVLAAQGFEAALAQDMKGHWGHFRQNVELTFPLVIFPLRFFPPVLGPTLSVSVSKRANGTGSP